MAMEDLKESLRESFQNLQSRIQESSAFQELQEKYQNLSPSAQKSVLASASFVFVLLLFMIPWIFFSSSTTSIDDFESKQELIRRTFSVKREASILPPAPPEVFEGSLLSGASGAPSISKLQPEQRGPDAISPLSKDSFVGIPKSLNQAGIQVKLSKLNLTQVVDVGHDLQNLHPMARLIGIEIKKSNPNDKKDDHYFDVVYKLVAVSAKAEPAAKSKGSRK